MELEGRVAIVTGGASGIGAALCRRFAAEGARGVVVADRDAAGARRVAEAVDGLAVVLDVADAGAVRDLVAQTEARYGPVDLFCANAGVGLGGGLGPEEGGPFASDADWEASWQVNVMAHVYAARAVLPSMRARGSGWILTTASAAGLLADFGSQAYTVTKHAAVAFAEWLAIRYRDDGIGVSCLCPQGVRTPMLRGVAAAGSDAHLTPGALEPEDVAEAVVEGLREEAFLILPHPEVREFLRRRGTDPERWLGGMQRLRRRLYGEG